MKQEIEPERTIRFIADGGDEFADLACLRGGDTEDAETASVADSGNELA